MSYAGSYSGAYGGSYAPGSLPVPLSSSDSEHGVMPGAPAPGIMSRTKQDYLQEFFGNGEEIDEFHPRTLYVGNLDPSISEEFLMSLFSQMGHVNKCKIIHETANDPYAFIEFSDHLSAVNALSAMNKRVLLEKEMRVNWATSPGAQQRIDTSKHYHVFVGDLSPEIDNKTLRDAFLPFGEISDVKVIRDLQTLKSKGYGFVSYVHREDAERSIESMNGQWLGRRTIRTNWATRKPGMPGTLTIDEVMGQASQGNSTVYVGGVGATTTEEDIRQVFNKYGNIVEIRVFRQQGYAFVRYEQKDEAAQAIVHINNTEINGSTVRCSWGREGGYAAAGPYSNYGYGYNVNAGSTNSANNYWGNQYYNYNQYYNPAAFQQWQAYWQQQGGGAASGGPQ